MRIPAALFLAAVCACSAAEPAPDPNAVTRPTFILDQKPAITAGIAWVLEEGGANYLVTSYHILGPQGGLQARIAPRDVPVEVRAIAGLCLGDSKIVLLAYPALYVAGARAFDERGCDADVTCAVLPDVRGVRPFKLAGAAPKAGDKVWLFARLVDRDRPLLYAATITETGASGAQYRFEDRTVNLRAASGAPVLDGDGSVVAMHVAAGNQTDALFGIGIPAPVLRERILAAAAAGAAK